ncbi:hypothetical protein GC175_27040 [bacterium]|nr:hypothetical protein [bacterium]
MQMQQIDTSPAYQAAQDELTRIERRRDPEQGRWQEYYRLVVDCLRYFLAQEHKVRTANRSVTEMQQALRRSTLSSAQTQPLLDLLAENDTVQMATYLPGPTQGRQLIGRARTMIDQMAQASTSTA